MFGRKRRTEPVPETQAEIVARLVRDGFLEQEFRLSERSERLLAANPQTMDDYTYWCVAIRAREAQAIVAGTSVTMAALGGPFYVEGDAIVVDLALSALVSQPTLPDGSPWADGGGALTDAAAMREP